MATIGTILIQASNQIGGITGGGSPSMVGVGDSTPSGDLRSQKKREDFEKKNLEQGEKAPKFWTAAFKKMGIQMGLAGILKQSQIFTSTIGSLFQIFGAFVDIILAPFVPLFIPAIRWLARKMPTVAKWAEGMGQKVEQWGHAFKAFIKDPFGTLGRVLQTFWGWLVEKLKALWNNTLGGTLGLPEFELKNGENGNGNGHNGKNGNGPVPPQVHGVPVPGADRANQAFRMAQGEMESFSLPEKVAVAAVVAKATVMTLRSGLHQVTPRGIINAGRGALRGATRGTGRAIQTGWEGFQGRSMRTAAGNVPPGAVRQTTGLFDDASDLGGVGRRVTSIPERIPTGRLGAIGDMIEGASRKFTGAMDTMGARVGGILDGIIDSHTAFMDKNLNVIRNIPLVGDMTYGAAKGLDQGSNWLMRNAFNLSKRVINNPVTRAAGRNIMPFAGAGMKAYDVAEGVWDTKNIIQAGMSGEKKWFEGINLGGWASGWKKPFTDPLSLSSYMGGQSGHLFPGAGYDALTRSTGTAAAALLPPVMGGMFSTATEYASGTGMIGPGQNRYGESDLLFELPSLLSTGFRRALNGIPGIQ